MTAVPWWAAYLVNPIRVGVGDVALSLGLASGINPSLTLPFLKTLVPI